MIKSLTTVNRPKSSRLMINRLKISRLKISRHTVKNPMINRQKISRRMVKSLMRNRLLASRPTFNQLMFGRGPFDHGPFGRDPFVRGLRFSRLLVSKRASVGAHGLRACLKELCLSPSVLLEASLAGRLVAAWVGLGGGDADQPQARFLGWSLKG
jgi:hypothetical protein